jgi:hypothetical protein
METAGVFGCFARSPEHQRHDHRDASMLVLSMHGVALPGTRAPTRQRIAEAGNKPHERWLACPLRSEHNESTIRRTALEMTTAERRRGSGPAAVDPTPDGEQAAPCGSACPGRRSPRCARRCTPREHACRSSHPRLHDEAGTSPCEPQVVPRRQVLPRFSTRAAPDAPFVETRVESGKTCVVASKSVQGGKP